MCVCVCVCDNVYKMYVFVGVGCFGLPQVFAKKNVVKRKAVMTKKKKQLTHLHITMMGLFSVAICVLVNMSANLSTELVESGQPFWGHPT